MSNNIPFLSYLLGIVTWNEFKLSIGGKISNYIPKNSSSLGIEFQGWIIG
jgi:hypothetical protein